MAKQVKVMRGLRRRPGMSCTVLTPKLNGLEAAVAEGATEVALFASASEGFSWKNINCSIDESIARFVPVLDAARRLASQVRGDSGAIQAQYGGNLVTHRTPDPLAFGQGLTACRASGSFLRAGFLADLEFALIGGRGVYHQDADTGCRIQARNPLRQVGLPDPPP
jgi:hypothetical protein